MYRYHPENIGEFTEVELGHNFTYRTTTNPWAVKHSLQHEIDVGAVRTIRFANVKQTVAYIAVDEDAEGKPVLEKWYIKKHVVFPKG